ncbi:dTDP-4-amino-4,6-dideoxygalactose transaminase [Singulisphaera sp. GP187]|uniref:DegT/DnrJ/EryC1/StrS family aminotransferase n=1 Tax=Singulisphaera sp. GP187 TaxID=1882752 RepID=UPI000928E1BB|nr:DegT/DnrJ/EryC1/StrS family aminotransferase [Singulisphaera sp. GP187]SIO09829.1 dTDP-4-amino-4,6-dideoxygalactose transaminase [Singulisphaera sp. GP187]
MGALIQSGLRRLIRMANSNTAGFRSPLTVGVIGCGAAGSNHLLGYEESGRARVIAVSDRVPTVLSKALDERPWLRGFQNYRRMLERARPEVVSICTWPDSHADLVEDAAASGVKGILCEKPLAVQMPEIRRVESICRAHGIKLGIGHQYRFNSLFIAAADLIRAGRIGRVTLVRGCIKSTVGNNGPHLVDSVRFLLGDPTALWVACRCWRERGGFDHGLPAEDSATGSIEFDGGVRFEFQVGDLSPTFFAITIEGTGGIIELTPEKLKVTGDKRTIRQSPGSSGRRRQFREFLRWVQGRQGTYSAAIEPGATAAELVLALYESSRKGGDRVDLPLGSEGDVIRQHFPGSSSRQAGGVALVNFEAPFENDEHGQLALNGGPRTMSRQYSLAPTVGIRELLNLTIVVASRRLNRLGGHMVPALERKFATWYGSPFAVASASGTAAIHVALGALDLDPGDEVITTPLTDMGTVIPILAANCLPVFADVDPKTGNVTAETIGARISPRTKAVILVHFFGRPADLDPLCELLQAKRIPLIEDCSQAHGATYRGRKVGTFGDFGCFSLQQSKQMTCGEGGLTLVNRTDLVTRAAMFADKGWDRTQGDRRHPFLGMNYRMTELQAAVALAQLGKLKDSLDARRRAADGLTRLLGAISGILPPVAQGDTIDSWLVYPFGIDEEGLGVSADEFCTALRVEGVRVSREYLTRPLFEHEVIKCQRTYGTSRYPFSAFPYQAPAADEFPGLKEYVRSLMYLEWGPRVCVHHTSSIARAIGKVARLLAHGRGTRPHLKDSLTGSI